MHTVDFFGKNLPYKTLALSGSIFCVLLSMLNAQPAPFPSREVKPKAAASPPLPPLPKVKGTIAKPPGPPDGKVNALNVEVFNAFEAIKRANPGALTTKNALSLREAIIKDDQIDALEADLLSEMTQSMFRSITITKAETAEKPPSLVSYPCSGHAKTVLRETLNPSLNLEEAWAAGISGWHSIVLESKKNDTEEQRVMAYLQLRIAEAWEKSNQANVYKPLRDLMAQRYGFSKAADFPADQAVNARNLMTEACRSVDTKAGDQIPDYLYTWWK